MKKPFLLLMLITTTFFAFARTGALSGEKKLQVVKTQWFDIIYPENCKKSASILYENADRIYGEVTEQYGMEPIDRIPIVITSTVERLNAFWASSPYSHIVLYDTSEDSLDSLSVFSETLLSVFRHELTHAVTYSMKNKFWRGVTKVFGETLGIGQFFVSTGMAEGATLTSESASDEGRLNDEFAKHSVKQAKIEDKFPSYYGVQGAGDLNPYYFNGAFHEWLQKTYGMEAYARFWYNTINIKGLTVNRRFSKAFKVKLKDAWNQFIKEYEVPNVSANPVSSKEVKDFFSPQNEKYSRLNNAGSFYTSLASSNKKIYWIDSSSNEIFSCKKEDNKIIEDEKKRVPIKTKFKKLFTQIGVYNVSPSIDDNYLAVSVYSDASLTMQARVKIYEPRSNQLYQVKEKGLKDGTIVKKGDDYYLVASKFKSPYNTIQIYKLLTRRNKRVYGTKKIKEIILPLNVFTASYVPLENKFAYIKKDKLKFTICISDIEGNIEQEFYPQQGEQRIVIHSLSYDDYYFENCEKVSQINFSWASKGTMPRDGVLKLEEKQILLSQKDISGGVFNPVYVNGDILYIGQFLNQNRLLSFSPNITNEYTEVENGVSQDNEDNRNEVDENIISNILDEDFYLPEIEKYNVFNYLTKGIFLPISIYSTDSVLTTKKYEKVPDLLIGATYITGNPWTNGSSNLFMFTGGINPLSRSVGIGITSNLGSDTSLATFSSTLKTEFDLNGWKYSSESISFGSGFHFGRVSSLSFTNTAFAAIGHQAKWIVTKENIFGKLAEYDPTIYYTLNDNISLKYSSLHFTGPGTYEIGGISALIGAVCKYEDALNNLQFSRFFNYDLYTSIYGYIPRLLPFESTYGFTTNFPSYVGFTFLPYNLDAIIEFNGEVILFGTLIKMPIPFLTGIYLQDWKISFGYQSEIETKTKYYINDPRFLHIKDYYQQIVIREFDYYDSFYLKAGINISPNIGAFSRNDLQVEIGGKWIYYPRPRVLTNNFKFNLEINFSL